jgi:Na+/melibiose symporter-like transporter
MLIGMPFYAIFFVVLFSPPVDLNSSQISIYFGVFYVLFFIADTVCNVPYNALGPELSTDSREREKLYIFATESWAIGKIDSAIAFCEEIVVKFPNDLLAVQRAQYHYFYQGDKLGLMNIAKVAFDFNPVA